MLRWEPAEPGVLASLDLGWWLRAIAGFAGHHLADRIDLVAAVALFVAAAGAWLAWRQLSTLTVQTRAGVFLALDQRWESDPILSIRTELNRLVDTWNAESRLIWLANPGTDPGAFVQEFYADKLEFLSAADLAKYERLFLLCGYFETVGFAAHTDHIPTNHVVSLLGASIMYLGEVFEVHIRRLHAKPRGNPKQFEHFLWLVAQARKVPRD